MVKSHILLFALLVAIATSAFIGSSHSWTGTYHIEHQGVKIWINQDGTIDLFYNISITLDSGDPINFVEIGQPNSDFTIGQGQAQDQYGRTLDASVSPDSNSKVRVRLYEPLTAGRTIWFTLMTNVAHMIWEDTKYPGNVGMEFKPNWWPVAEVYDLQVQVVLPQGVTQAEVHTGEELWSGTTVEDNQLSIYWKRENLAPDQTYTFGVSFPKQYVQKYETQPTGIAAFLQRYGSALGIFALVVLAIGAVVVVVRKRPYLLPTMSMETLGIRHGLTAVEASYLLDLKPTMIVTEVLYSLLQKRAVWVESSVPSLKLKLMPAFENKVGPQETPLRYYEIDFLDAISEDGSLEEEKLARSVISLRDTVEEKMRGYCRRDTIDYYKSVVTKAWEQVEQAGTAELASKAYDEQLLWLFMDPNYQMRTETAFRDRAFEPSPLWLWYWYGYQHYNPHPTYKTNVEAPAQAGKPPTIPGAEFANNIASAVEKTSNNVVANLEKFANAIVSAPAASKASSEPAHHGASCVCACAACACACACVSCACACAGGGVG